MDVKIGWQYYRLWVLLGMIFLSVVLGVLNNLRVYEEQRVPWMSVDSNQKGNAK